MTDIELAIEGIDHAGLRERVRAIADSERISQKALALEAGIANGTFSNWLGDTYGGDIDKVGRQVSTWLEARPTRSRVQAQMPAAPNFIETPASSLFVSVLEHAHFMPDIGLIVGAPGVGKTEACRFYQKTHPHVFMVTAEPCGGSARAMLEMLAVAMNVTVAGISAPKLSWEMARRLRPVSALVIVDEAQHLAPTALDQLRTLYDQAGCGVALVGNGTIFARIDGGGREHFAQLTSRVGMRVSRARPSAEDVGTLLDAWAIREADIRSTLHAIARKPGALRGMTKTLRLAHKLALAGSVPLALNHVQAAWARLSNDEELRPAVKGAAA